MLRSLRDATHKAGFTEPVISLQRLAPHYHLGPSLSLQDLMGDLVPEHVTFNTGEIKAGDVKGWAELTILSNGYWLFRGHLHDSGTFFGDHYLLAIALNYVDESRHIIAVQQQGKLGVSGDSQRVDWEQQGREPKIKANWHHLVSHGMTPRLAVSPDISDFTVVLANVLLGIATVGAVFLFPKTSNGNNCRQVIDPDTGQEVWRCREEW